MALFATSAWATDWIRLDSIDFTNTTNFPAQTITGTSSEYATKTIKGVFFRANKSKNIKINNSTPGVDFDGQNGDKSKHHLAIPVTGVNGSLKVIVYHDYNNTSANHKVGVSHATGNDPSATQTWDLEPTNSGGTKNKNDFVMTKSSLTGTEYIVWVAESSSSYNVVKRVAIYTEAPTGYSVTYVENGHGATQTDLTGQTALPNPLPTLSENGWIFGGWFTDNGTFETAAVAGATLSANATLYAKWTEDPSVTKYTVTYSLNGPSGDAPTQASVAAGTSITLAAAPSWAGHAFDGWLCNIDDKVKAAGSAYTMTAANTTFTAQWTELFAITEGTPANGSVDADLAEAPAGTTITLTATPAFRYLFGAWDVYKTGDESTKVTVTNNKFTMPEYAVTVSATFTADARKQILYLTTASTSSDKLYAALNSVETYNVIVEAPEAQTLTNYDLVVLHESISGNTANPDHKDKKQVILDIPTTTIPVLNTKSYFYTSARWNWGEPNAGKKPTGVHIDATYCNILSHPLFAGLTPDANDSIAILSSIHTDNKPIQPVGSFVSGKAGYTLASVPNNESDNGSAIHELTPAQRGVASGKYLMISVYSKDLNNLNANGQKLFQNAAAYLLSDETWTPKTLEVTIADGIEHGSVDADITCAAADDEITLSNEPADGYQFVAYDVYKTGDAETKVEVSEGKFTMPEYAVTVSATFAELFAITCSPAENGSVTADKAQAIAGETITLTLAPADGYKVASVTVNGGDPLAVSENTATFTMPAAAANVVATFSVATAIDNTEDEVKAVKVLRDGQLFIEKNGHVYNVFGACIK